MFRVGCHGDWLSLTCLLLLDCIQSLSFHPLTVNDSKLSYHCPSSRNVFYFGLFSPFKQLGILFPFKQLVGALAPPTPLHGKRTNYLRDPLFHEITDQVGTASLTNGIIVVPFFVSLAAAFGKEPCLAFCAAKVFEAVTTRQSKGSSFWFLRKAAADQLWDQRKIIFGPTLKTSQAFANPK